MQEELTTLKFNEIEEFHEYCDVFSLNKKATGYVLIGFIKRFKEFKAAGFTL